MTAKRAKISPDAIARMIRGDDHAINMADLGRNFVQIVGGPAMLAQMLHDEFNKAKAGGMIRARILDMIIQVLKFVQINNPPPDDYGLVSDEDIDREIERNLLKVEMYGQAEEVPDGRPGRRQEETGSGDAGADPASRAAAAAEPPASAAAYPASGIAAGGAAQASQREGEPPPGSAADVQPDAGAAGVPFVDGTGTDH